MDVGLAIKAALERAEQHERLARRKLSVRLRMHFGDGHHTRGLHISARFAARDNDELIGQGDGVGERVVPWEDLTARAGDLVGLVDECVAEVEGGVGEARHD